MYLYGRPLPSHGSHILGAYLRVTVMSLWVCVNSALLHTACTRYCTVVIQHTPHRSDLNSWYLDISTSVLAGATGCRN